MVMWFQHPNVLNLKLNVRHVENGRGLQGDKGFFSVTGVDSIELRELLAECKRK